MTEESRSPSSADRPAASPRAGQVSVVTGGSAGLGLAIAGAVARAGSAVVLASRSAERCEQAAGRLTAQTGLVRPHPHPRQRTRARRRRGRAGYAASKGAVVQLTVFPSMAAGQATDRARQLPPDRSPEAATVLSGELCVGDLGYQPVPGEFCLGFSPARHHFRL